MKRFGALRFVRTSIEPRESLQDGAILVENAAVKNWYRCDCGKEISHWNRDIKGKELSLLTDCGCGILARQEAEKEKADISESDNVLDRILAHSGSRDGSQKVSKMFSIDLDLMVRLNTYAKKNGVGISQALSYLLTIALDGDKK